MIVFSNQSLIPLEAVTTVGVSVKETDNAIGKFGTGIKYAIAGILRLGGSITIYRDGIPYSFSFRETTIRGTPFQIVHMNDQPLGFTTDLGKHWLPWMIVRELYSNCLDEDGVHGSQRTHAPTEIVVVGSAFEEAYRNRGEWLIGRDTLLHSGEFVEIHRKRGDGQIFYQGIAVGDSPWPSAYSYNFLRDLSLTEDRTYRNPYLMLTLAARSLDGVPLDIFKTIAQSDPRSFEGLIDYYYHPISQVAHEWLHTMHQNRATGLNVHAMQYCRRHFGAQAQETRPATPLEQEKLTRASALLRALSLPIPEVHIPTGDFPDAYGFVEDNKVFITARCLDEGVSQVAMTLVEEVLHHAYDIEDYSREMQDRLLRLILSLYENQKGMPL